MVTGMVKGTEMGTRDGAVGDRYVKQWGTSMLSSGGPPCQAVGDHYDPAFRWVVVILDFWSSRYEAGDCCE